MDELRTGSQREIRKPIKTIHSIKVKPYVSETTTYGLITQNLLDNIQRLLIESCLSSVPPLHSYSNGVANQPSLYSAQLFNSLR